MKDIASNQSNDWSLWYGKLRPVENPSIKIISQRPGREILLFDFNLTVGFRSSDLKSVNNMQQAITLPSDDPDVRRHIVSLCHSDSMGIKNSHAPSYISLKSA